MTLPKNIEDLRKLQCVKKQEDSQKEKMEKMRGCIKEKTKDVDKKAEFAQVKKCIAAETPK